MGDIINDISMVKKKHGAYSIGVHYLLYKSTLSMVNFVGHTINEETQTKKTNSNHTIQH